jgi:RNA polymerase sigma factor (sigma-70 family)
MRRSSNRDLVEQLKSGDRHGCTLLVQAYQNRLISEALNVFHLDRMDAEELVSDVLLTVVQKIDGFQFTRSDGDFHYWVMTIFRNRMRDFIRHQALTEGMMQRFEEAALEDDDAYSSTEKEVATTILRQYQESLKTIDESEEISLHEKAGGGSHSSARTYPGKLQIIAETLESMETWERVLLRCRALDVPYEDIAHYTGKPAKILKVYHARVKTKFIKLLSQHYPELTTE